MRVRENLERAGARVIEGENGQAALDALATERPILVLSDLLMPVMDGFELITRIRSNADWSTIPIIVVTSKDLTADDRRRLAGNVEVLLEKGGIDDGRLLAELRASLAGAERP